ncbi:MAG: SCO family protein [Pyrinomonadaceae bacterium]
MKALRETKSARYSTSSRADKRCSGRRRKAVLLAALCVVWLSTPVLAQYATGPLELQKQDQRQSSAMPQVLQNIGIDQRLNEQLPLDATFRDEAGRDVKLGDYFKSGKPVVLSLVYYDCPMLCTQVLNGQVEAFRALPFTLGKDFDAVSVSFDPRETPELAAGKKGVYVNDYKRPGAREGWHFLTGDEPSIKRLTQATGFHYAYDEQTKQFAHASAVMIATPEGRLARYFYGIAYPPREMRLGLIEAAAGRIGSPVNQLIFYCYHYDPATGKYGLLVINIIRLGGALTVLSLVAMILLLRRRKTGAATVDHLEPRGAV